MSAVFWQPGVLTATLDKLQREQIVVDLSDFRRTMTQLSRQHEREQASAQRVDGLSPQDQALFDRYPDLAFIHMARTTVESNPNPMCRPVAILAAQLETLGRGYAMRGGPLAGAVIANAKSDLLNSAARYEYCFR